MSCSPAPGENEPRFRIRVCMRRYFADERARCLLLVPARRRVRWLARRLRALFPLPPRMALLCRGHLLPRDEPLALLDADDVVEVVPRRASRATERPEVVADMIDAEGFVDDLRVEATDEKDVVGIDAEDAIDSVDCASQAAVVPHAPAAELDGLSYSKRRALAVLEQYCSSSATPVAAQPRVRRRRVRRRRRPVAWGLSELAGDAMQCGEEEQRLEASDEVEQRGEASGNIVQHGEASGEGEQRGEEEKCGEASDPVVEHGKVSGEVLQRGEEEKRGEKEQRSEASGCVVQSGEMIVDAVQRGEADGMRPRAPRLVRALTGPTPFSFESSNSIY